MTGNERCDGGSADDLDDLSALAERAAGASVTPTRLWAVTGDRATFRDTLDADEQPHYLLEGTMIDVLTGEERARKVASRDGAAFTLVTDRAIRFVVQYAERLDTRTVPFEAVRAVGLQTVGRNARLSVETADGGYEAYPSATPAEECRAAVAYVEQRVGEPRPEAEAGGLREDALDALERLASLHERGALTDAEFEAKKRELLDRL
jgi:hypothetical protein